ncbi:MAG: zinc metallopeptidase [Chitinophagaceae bacterium]|nr:MAG: zinc metallopeptidase [Chitinophagaceae bacterium]
MEFLILILLIMGASWYVGNKLQRKFDQYSKVPLQSGLSGKEIAKKMLNESGIYDVEIISVQGRLTDHYNPLNKTVNLSPDVYNGRSVAAAAVAAHECGHAIQHATAYSFLKMRSALVPVVSFASKYIPWLLIGGILLLQTFPYLLLFGIFLFATTTLFSFVTLPVEIDASKRALNWLNSTKITHGEEHVMAKDALKWAAKTYVVAALASLATLLYYVMIYMSRR